LFRTEADLQQHLDSAEKSPKQIAAAAAGLPDKILRYKSSPEKWCILEILGHVADAEIIIAYRIRQMLADKAPVIAPIDEDAWAKHLGYLESSPCGSGRIASRKRSMSLVDHE
jgi:DinB superfamily